MAHRVCPWWLGYFLASPLRRLLGDSPARILDSYIRPGMTVLEPGPGMGYFTLELARQVGPSGRVIAVDVQQKMIAGLKRRLAKAGFTEGVDTRLAPADSMGLTDIAGKVDFTLAFAVVHEFPDATRFFAETAAASRPGAQLLFAEPAGHVSDELFVEEITQAERAGFAVVARPAIRRSHAALLRKNTSEP